MVKTQKDNYRKLQRTEQPNPRKGLMVWNGIEWVSAR